MVVKINTVTHDNALAGLKVEDIHLLSVSYGCASHTVTHNNAPAELRHFTDNHLKTLLAY